MQVYTHSTAARCVTDRAVDTERAPVAIGDHTFIGANSVVLMGVTIGSRCVIGAGSVVTRDVPDGMCATGVPARAGRVRSTRRRRGSPACREHLAQGLDHAVLVGVREVGVHRQGEVAPEQQVGRRAVGGCGVHRLAVQCVGADL